MRIRSIKPEFWSSEDIAALDWDTRLLFIGLWSYVDDNGVGRDNEKLITADLFPLEDDPRETLARVSRGLQELSRRSLLTRYTVEGRDFIHITTWSRHQRIDKPNKDRYPLPTRDDAVIRDTLATPSRDTRDTLAPGAGEQGIREQGTGDQDPSSTTPLRDDVARILDHLDERIRANGAKMPRRTKTNTDAARLLVDLDRRDPDEIHRIIDWATNDSFWRAHILSAKQLRQKYDQLKLASASGPRYSDPRQAIFDAWDERIPDPIEGNLL